MTWLEFPYFAAVSALFYVAGSVFLYTSKNKLWGNAAIITGLAVLGTFIGAFWAGLDRLPLRTLGETRLWYAFFLVLAGYLTYLRWGIKWIVPYSCGLALMFLILNIVFVEAHDKTLMPALQSPWFAPHVIVYMISYAVLAASALVSAKALFEMFFRNRHVNDDVLKLADNLVSVGFTFLSLGLIFGAFWAKEAWGHYWTWDPKETWALLTWLAYLVYIHIRFRHKQNENLAYFLLFISFVVLIVAWFGINYLPSAANSVHTYSN
ncbi:MAG TPA: cytochrome c biogenesis protein CcsA [Bacteroidales bacterium]|nr:cytochrome c biogenesis protein CcsA [Bacteroidales bacterium]